MNYLLDTYVLLWLLLEPHKLSALHYQQLVSKEADIKYVSPISLWEISLKFSLGKLDLLGNTPEQILEECRAIGLEIAVLQPEQFASFHLLPPVKNHRDPFDRMLIWQAIQGQYALLSSDRQLADYGVHGLQVA